MQVVTLRSLVDQAIAKLPPAKRLSARFHMRRRSDEILAHLTAELVDEPDCCDAVAILDAEGFSGSVSFAIDPDKLEKWLALIVKWLPIILALFK